MPLYDYRCQSCHFEFDAFSPMEARHSMACQLCNGPTEIVFKKAPALAIFQAGVWEDLGPEPIYIDSAQQLRDEAARRDATIPLLENGIWRTNDDERKRQEDKRGSEDHVLRQRGT